MSAKKEAAIEEHKTKRAEAAQQSKAYEDSLNQLDENVNTLTAEQLKINNALTTTNSALKTTTHALTKAKEREVTTLQNFKTAVTAVTTIKTKIRTLDFKKVTNIENIFFSHTL